MKHNHSKSNLKSPDLSPHTSRHRGQRRIVRILCLILLMLCIILILLCIRKIRFLDYTPVASQESTQVLSNPYNGFYTMTGITLSDADVPSIPDALKSAPASTQVVMLEINLLQYRNRDLSDSALQNLDTYLNSWKSTGHQMILRFLYDWNGNNMTSEPDNIGQVISHMKQVAPVVNKYKDMIYLMQGIFVGNCGEMNQSHYLDADSMTQLIDTLASAIDPSIYLAVRTPLQRRTILNSAQTLSKKEAFSGTLPSRLGLFNDGMLGSANDTGTYGDGSHTTSEPLAAWSRADELDYQNQLCNYVQNGGEVITDNPYNDLDTAIQDLKTMHVSYLNKDHDQAVLNKWEQTTYTGSDTAYNGLSGYDYIAAHLGYRYTPVSSHCTLASPLDQHAVLTVRIKNTGFSSCYRPFHVTLSIVGADGELKDHIPVPADTRNWTSGNTIRLKASLPVRDYTAGNYQIYLNLSDPVLEQNIYLATDATYTQYGYLLGNLTISDLIKHSK